MNFSVIICTYMRPETTCGLMESITIQTVQPSEVIIVDGSTDFKTRELFQKKTYSFPLKYILVEIKDRGLTKQRNAGIQHIGTGVDIVFFLDDDIILEKDYFEKSLSSFNDSNVIGTNGWITNESDWKKTSEKDQISKKSIVIDGFFQELSSRDTLRAALGLYPFNIQPGKIPPYAHGKMSLPPSDKTYVVDHLIGCNMGFRRFLFDKIQFSHFFEGYGLYEDFDFSVRASRHGKLVTNTAARLAHYHAPGGRPNFYKYGRMVVRNGWYVWRLKHPHPGAVNILKWHLITCLLMFIRLGNALTGPRRQDAFDDFWGRFTSWVMLWFRKPWIER